MSGGKVYANVLFADFEAFQHGNEQFQIKELCIVAEDAPLKPLYFLFKPSIPWEELTSDQRRTYSYEDRYIHHLAWGEGERRYCQQCIQREIQEKFFPPAICYVLGREKVKFLREQLPTLNVVEYSYANSFKDIPHAPPHLTCLYRSHSREHCAVLKCYRLLSHYNSVGAY